MASDSIIAKIETITDQLAVERFQEYQTTNWTLKADPYYGVEKMTSVTMEPIPCFRTEIVKGMTEELILPPDAASQFRNQLYAVILDIGSRFVDRRELIDTLYKYASLNSDDINPDSWPIFARVTNTVANSVRNYSPFSMGIPTSQIIASLFTGWSKDTVIEQLAKTPEQIATSPMHLYNHLLRPVCLDYIRTANATRDKGGIRIVTDGRSFDVIEKVVPTDTLGILYQEVQSMYRHLASNDCAYNKFAAAEDCYHRFLAELANHTVLSNIESAMDEIDSGGNYADILEQMVGLNEADAVMTVKTKIVQKAHIAALLMMKVMIHGTGRKAQQQCQLFGIPTRANSVDVTGCSMLFSVDEMTRFNTVMSQDLFRQLSAMPFATLTENDTGEKLLEAITNYKKVVQEKIVAGHQSRDKHIETILSIAADGVRQIGEIVCDGSQPKEAPADQTKTTPPKSEEAPADQAKTTTPPKSETAPADTNKLISKLNKLPGVNAVVEDNRVKITSPLRTIFCGIDCLFKIAPEFMKAHNVHAEMVQLEELLAEIETNIRPIAVFYDQTIKCLQSNPTALKVVTDSVTAPAKHPNIKITPYHIPHAKVE